MIAYWLSIIFPNLSIIKNNLLFYSYILKITILNLQSLKESSNALLRWYCTERIAMLCIKNTIPDGRLTAADSNPDSPVEYARSLPFFISFNVILTWKRPLSDITVKPIISPFRPALKPKLGQKGAFCGIKTYDA